MLFFVMFSVSIPAFWVAAPRNGQYIVCGTEQRLLGFGTVARWSSSEHLPRLQRSVTSLLYALVAANGAPI
jgi:hypothetical protein